ncbi:GNAT family N-acetyltransferase [Pantoea rodasii]|uniref:GNAT family N-acetyltransferase n=1 Tax=Pantoea rodasii TaxID=1076549 RepID=A0A2M9W991_9GAMM|nr:GNAT family N-acetyltransferase [Pantoea rodasii]ORM63985.1 GNAT family N-acetyltransferase [Pantoea rodasii]PJZ04100.1 GNAT family N-acetyltransferase [Pantoea rodasii]
MRLETERLLLRPVRECDLIDLFRIYGDPATNTFNPAGPYPDIDHARNVLKHWLRHWTNYGFGCWAIAEKLTPSSIIGFGGLTLRSLEFFTVNNLGYRLETAVWGKGYATEFARFSVDYGFRHLDLQEISATVRAHHLSSQGVLKKSGLRFIREIHDVENASPSLLYSIKKNEWLGNSCSLQAVDRIQG